MTIEEIIKGNKLIADFMGVTVYPISGTKDEKEWKGEKRDHYNHELCYEKSWDWLMPVVEKIQSKFMLYEMYEQIEQALLTLKIDLVFRAVVEFIKWYNENYKL